MKEFSVINTYKIHRKYKDTHIKNFLKLAQGSQNMKWNV